MVGHTLTVAPFVLLVIGHVLAAYVDPKVLDACPGYKATDIQERPDGLTASLVLRSTACNVFGNDIQKLSLTVLYESANRIHLKITDASSARYEIPESVLPLPKSTGSVSPSNSAIGFNYTTSPFSFSVYRTSNKDVLFSTSSFPIIFEPQYLRIKSSIPANANIYGLGEHSNPFHIPTDNTTLTLWSRDAYGLPTATNLYGAHPVYFEHRTTGTHAVFFRNSDGMDIKITKDGPSGPALEYNIIGGVIDLYFLAGSETDPVEVAKQYAEVVGTPAEVPYWSFGLHQCRFGYKNFIDVANVITNYSASKIPLETMWTDIDYMDRRRIFTVDPDYFPLNRMREIVSYLHAHGQKYILMTDPAVAYLPNGGYGPYDRGYALDVFLKANNGSESLGVVWPGVTVFPDWFHPQVQNFWTEEFKSFYNPETGIDIDGAWIDMNEPSNFCTLPCDDPFQQAIAMQMPPARDTPKPDPNAPIFTSSTSRSVKRDFLDPPYAINNAFGPLSSRTAFTNIIHANGLTEYDTHNLYGTMMSKATRDAMLARRPGRRTLVITRSTFAGAGSYVQKWLGDNMSTWEQYRSSIAEMLGFASIYLVPMVGSDICGFGGDVTETLCARWATLGAFYPFMRNHNSDTSISHEFYVWPTVAQAARNALDMRYRLLDYIYTAFHQASLDGTPVLNPLWFKYPKDPNTFGIDLQFFYGDSILVSPVTQEDATSVIAYFPNDIFYDFKTLKPIQGNGANVNLENLDVTQIPVYIKGGTVLPLRAQSAITTNELRKKDFELVIAPNAAGEAFGQLYYDDGDSIEPESSTFIKFSFEDRSLSMSGTFGYPLQVNLSRVRILGLERAPEMVCVDGKVAVTGYNPTTMILDVTIGQPFTREFQVSYHN